MPRFLDFQTMWQISADEPYATPKWKHQPPSANYETRQECGLPEHVRFMATCLISVNFQKVEKPIGEREGLFLLMGELHCSGI